MRFLKAPKPVVLFWFLTPNITFPGLTFAVSGPREQKLLEFRV
jgi:hypothetical protein